MVFYYGFAQSVLILMFKHGYAFTDMQQYWPKIITNKFNHGVEGGGWDVMML